MEKAKRLISIDMMRGFAIVIMALDHVREFFTSARFSPTDLTQTTAPLFLTRWITNFCAPVFVFLAGTGAFLYYVRGGKTKSELAWYLFTRGLFLIFIELVIVRFACSFNFNYMDSNANVCQVIWAIGWSMIFLACIVRLPVWLIAAIGGIIVAGHNLLDGLASVCPQSLRWLLIVLHSRDMITILPGLELKITYPLIPWIGVISLGFAFGSIVILEEKARQKIIFLLGTAAIGAFIILRALNIYGDPSQWTIQKNALFTFFSFINCSKYPPSLLYLLMTLGPALVLLSMLKEEERPVARFFLVFGRVSLFFYIMHLLLIHTIALVVATLKYHAIPAWMFQGNPIFSDPGFPAGPVDYGYGLPVIYLVWVVVIVALFPLCRWYMNYKNTHKYFWLSYL